VTPDPERDMTPALGSAGGPAWGEHTEGETVALHVGEWRDGRWSYLYKDDTRYAAEAADGAADARGSRDDEAPFVIGPVIHEPVWTWEVPAYFWLGGMAAGSSFVALACDLAGDEKSARIARMTALGAVAPAPILLIMDLGRPARFLNMLRIFKPRSPMSLGSWCLVTFSTLAAGAVGLDLLGRKRAAKALGGANALVGGYLGSYTGVLLASTAVPLWARSRLFLGPIFVCTGAATGAALNRIVLIAAGLPDGHPTRDALGRVETGAMVAELALSTINEKRLGPLARGLEHGTPGKQFRAAKWLVRTGLALRLVRERSGRPAHDVASVLYLLAGLLFRFAWVGAGKLSARDDEMVARMHRGETV
jgi:formate-dependent nitrite reductase membrane component NrfD